MNMLWKRLFEDNKFAWRRVYKVSGSVESREGPALSAIDRIASVRLQSLILLEHLLKNGSERVIGSARDHAFQVRIPYPTLFGKQYRLQLRSLESYKFTDEKGKDQGINGELWVD